MKALIKKALQPVRDRLEQRRLCPLYTGIHQNLDPGIHMREAADWICRAQDHGTDRGVAYGAPLDGDFLASYPETTGYIIPTMLELADVLGEESFRERAGEMGDWEISIQLPTGAVRAGRLDLADPNPAPAIFNTGQVLLGWTALLRATGEARYREAGLGAARWMIEQQEPDGNWIRGNSPRANPSTTTYNVKAAWGLCGFGIEAGYAPAVEAAVKNGDYALRRQLQNGWYEGCCLTDATQPLLHTIAYSMQGLIGIGRLTGEQRFLDGAMKTAQSLIGLMDSEGFLPGRIDRNFEGTVSWCCLTGSAQTSEVWWQLYELTKDGSFRDAALRVNRYLMARHDISSDNPAVRGGVAGSWPVQGEYGRYLVLNWATKFFLDALLGQHRLAGNE